MPPQFAFLRRKSSDYGNLGFSELATLGLLNFKAPNRQTGFNLMAKQYKAAIVGCGSIGQAHMQGYLRLDNVDVVAVADPLEPARQMYMDNYGISQGYATVTEMLEKAQPDLVSVCVWHLLHDTVSAEVATGPSVKGIICE